MLGKVLIGVGQRENRGEKDGDGDSTLFSAVFFFFFNTSREIGSPREVKWGLWLLSIYVNTENE